MMSSFETTFWKIVVVVGSAILLVLCVFLLAFVVLAATSEGIELSRCRDSVAHAPTGRYDAVTCRSDQDLARDGDVVLCTCRRPVEDP